MRRLFHCHVHQRNWRDGQFLAAGETGLMDFVIEWQLHFARFQNCFEFESVF